MEGFCRGCLIKYTEPTELLQYTEKNRRLFIYSTGLQVKRNDTLLFQLCKECYLNMKVSCKFKKLCRTSDKKFKNYLALKDFGDNIDFCTFLKNNDDTLTFRFPLMSGNSTPANQKCRDDDNESTCTSIRNFMTDILQGEEMPDTEARIIREVIEEEADVLDESLDSHWLQDDASIDTDFRLDFSFSPFSTPRPVNNDRYTPQKLSNQKEREQLNYYTSRQIMERHDNIEISIEPKDLSTHVDTVQNIIPSDDDLEQNIVMTADNDVSLDVVSADIDMKENIIPTDIDIDQNIILTNTNEEHVNTEILMDQNILLTDIDAEQSIISTDIDIEQNIIPMKVDIKENDTPQLVKNNIENDYIESIYDKSLKELQNDYYTANKELNNKYHIEKELNDQVLQPIFCKDINLDKANNVRCTIDKNLEHALKNEENKEFSLDELLVSPSVYPGASTPTITNILFGDKLNIESDNDTDAHKVGQCIEKFEDVQGNIDVLKEFFGNNEHDYDIGGPFAGSNDTTENGNFKVPLTPKDDDYDMDKCYCNLCKKQFKLPKALRLHFAHKHKMNIFNPNKKAYRKAPKVCHICGKLYRDGVNLHLHLKRHESDNKTYKCDLCKLQCTTQARLDMHIASHKGVFVKKNTGQKFVCNICGAVINSISNFKLHQRRHTDNYLVNCKECGKGFHRSADLTAHMRYHTRERPYTCMYCPKAFSRGNALTKHIKIHLGNKIYQCDLCNNKFTTRSELNYHLKKSKSCSKQREQLVIKESQAVVKSDVTIAYMPGSTETIQNQLPFIETEQSN